MESSVGRRLGLEQEFFLVDEDGMLSELSDEFLEACWWLAGEEGLDPGRFAPECARSMVEVSTPPAHGVAELRVHYLTHLELALRAGRSLGLRLYPLATYPLPATPTVRQKPRYQAQSLTIGSEHFLNAGRCVGVHLHLELPEGVLDRRSGISPEAPESAREELLDAYNLATALDPALVALTRSCPFYQGIAEGFAARTTHYRGDPEFAPHGLYSALPLAGGLLPYADCPCDLVELQFARYESWLTAMERAGADPGDFFGEEPSASRLLEPAWNPVRLNAQDGFRGTVELRSADSTYPEVILAVSSLVDVVAGRMRREGLRVTPCGGRTVFEAAGDRLLVPDFDYLSGELLRDAASCGSKSPAIAAYLDSIVRFAGDFEELGSLRGETGYRCTEREILGRMALSREPDSALSNEEGLALVREACRELETQVSTLLTHSPPRPQASGSEDGNPLVS